MNSQNFLPCLNFQSQSLPSRAEVRNALSVTIGGGNVAVTRITTPKELTVSLKPNLAHQFSSLSYSLVFWQIIFLHFVVVES